MPTLPTLIGIVAAVCTTVSYIPQLRKCWTTGSAADLSLYMFLVLAAGLSLWVVYGFLQKDWVIVIANVVSVTLLGVIIGFKLREMWTARAKGKSGKATQA
jgi:MtN3 and saliva related transmembrane protein